MSWKDDWKERAKELLNDFDEHLQSMPDKGDVCEDSQKVCVRIALNELYATVNGVEDEDFVQDDDDE